VLVVAIADNGVIGRAAGLPWHLPDDLRYFKAVTLGKPVLMGRRTFEAIGRPLPGRRNLVMSRQGAGSSAGSIDIAGAEAGPGAGAAGAEYVPDLPAALERIATAPELCVIGGAQIYAMTLPLATRVYLTHVHAAVEGEVRFPLSDWGAWREVARHEHPADARHAYAMSFVTLERA